MIALAANPSPPLCRSNLFVYAKSLRHHVSIYRHTNGARRGMAHIITCSRDSLSEARTLRACELESNSKECSQKLLLSCSHSTVSSPLLLLSQATSCCKGASRKH